MTSAPRTGRRVTREACVGLAVLVLVLLLVLVSGPWAVWRSSSDPGASSQVESSDSWDADGVAPRRNRTTPRTSATPDGAPPEADVQPHGAGLVVVVHAGDSDLGSTDSAASLSVISDPQRQVLESLPLIMEAGRATIVIPRPDRRVVLRGLIPGRASGSTLFDPSVAGDEVAVHLRETMLLSVRVLNGDTGDGLQALVATQEREPSGARIDFEQLSTDDEGRVRLGLPLSRSSEFCIRAEAPGFEVKSVLVSSLDPGTTGAELLVRLRPSPSLRVRCVDASTKRPVAGALVVVGERRRARTGPDGVVTVSLPHLTGAVPVSASRTGFAASATWIDAGGEDGYAVTLEMRAGSTLEGRLYSWDGSAPGCPGRLELSYGVRPDAGVLPGMAVVLRTSASVAADGTFSVPDLPSMFDVDRSMLIATTADGRFAHRRLGGVRGHLDVRLSRTAELSQGTVSIRRRDGAPLRQTRLLLRRARVEDGGDASERLQPRWDSGSVIEVEVVGSGSVQTARPAWSPESMTAEILVWDADTAPTTVRLNGRDQEVVLDTIHELRGRVVAECDLGTDRPFVQLWSEDSPRAFIAGVPTDTDGRFRVRFPAAYLDARCRVVVLAFSDGVRVEDAVDLAGLRGGDVNLTLRLPE